MKPIKTLVLVADDAQARLFENHGPGKGLSEIEDLAVSMIAGAGAEYSDRSGRNSAAPGMAQHGVADLAEAEHDQARGLFVKAVLAEVEDRFRDGGFDRFVMVADPGTLGALRKQLPGALKAALVADMSKNFLKLSPAELVDRLSGEIVL